MSSVGALRRKVDPTTWETQVHGVVTIPDTSFLAGLATDAEAGQTVWDASTDTMWVFNGTKHIPIVAGQSAVIGGVITATGTGSNETTWAKLAIPSEIAKLTPGTYLFVGVDADPIDAATPGIGGGKAAVGDMVSVIDNDSDGTADTLGLITLGGGGSTGVVAGAIVTNPTRVFEHSWDQLASSSDPAATKIVGEWMWNPNSQFLGGPGQGGFSSTDDQIGLSSAASTGGNVLSAGMFHRGDIIRVESSADPTKWSEYGVVGRVSAAGAGLFIAAGLHASGGGGAPAGAVTLSISKVVSPRLAAIPPGSYLLVSHGSQIPPGVPGVGHEMVTAESFVVAVDEDGDGTSDSIAELPNATVSGDWEPIEKLYGGKPSGSYYSPSVQLDWATYRAFRIVFSVKGDGVEFRTGGQPKMDLHGLKVESSGNTPWVGGYLASPTNIRITNTKGNYEGELLLANQRDLFHRVDLVGIEDGGNYVEISGLADASDAGRPDTIQLRTGNSTMIFEMVVEGQVA